MLSDIADDGLHIQITQLDKIGFDTRTFLLHCG